MLKLQQDPTFQAKVEIPLPGDKLAVVKCTFRWMHRNDVRGFLSSLAAMGRLASPVAVLWQRALRLAAKAPGLEAWAGKRIVPFRSDFDVLNHVLVSWDGVDMEWSEAACKQLIELHPSAPALIIGAWCSGLAERRLGN